MERQRLHRQLAELRGRIRVLVRVRPVIREDGDSKVVVHVDTVDDSQLMVRREQREKTFSMDRAFGISSTQQEVSAGSCKSGWWHVQCPPPFMLLGDVSAARVPVNNCCVIYCFGLSPAVTVLLGVACQ